MQFYGLSFESVSLKSIVTTVQRFVECDCTQRCGCYACSVAGESTGLIQDFHLGKFPLMILQRLTYPTRLAHTIMHAPYTHCRVRFIFDPTQLLFGLAAFHLGRSRIRYMQTLRVCTCSAQS